MEDRRITTEHLSEEVFVAWNGPEIQHCDNVLREEHSTDIQVWWQAVALHYFQGCKVHTISQAVDSI